MSDQVALLLFVVIGITLFSLIRFLVRWALFKSANLDRFSDQMAPQEITKVVSECLDTPPRSSLAFRFCIWCVFGILSYFMFVLRLNVLVTGVALIVACAAVFLTDFCLTLHGLRRRLWSELSRLGVCVCYRCGYNLHACKSPVCPECGSAISGQTVFQENKKTRM